MLVVGEREKAEQTVAVRDMSGKDLGGMQLSSVIKLLKQKPAEN